MSNGKAEGEDDSSIDLIKDAGNFLLKNSCNTFCQMLAKLYRSIWKNAIIIFIDKIGNINNLNNIVQ